jgi:hypothetical protein
VLKGVLVLALMIICGAGGYILGVSKSQKSIQVPAQSAYVAPTTAATSTQAATLPSAPVPSQEMATVVPSQDPIGKIFTMDMINAQVGYLEAITGPAWQQTAATAQSPEQRIYKLAACQVSATIVNGAITSLGMDLGPECTIDLNKFFDTGAKIPSANTLTFGTFENDIGSGHFYSDCLSMCGNAFDPSIFEHYMGPHAANFLEVLISAKQVTDPIIDAAEKWSDMMTKAKGQDYVGNMTFNCDGQYDAPAHTLFASIPITSMTIGYNLQGPWTACGTSTTQ